MDWYYVDGGAQAGPVNETEFAQLVATGKIRPATLVWHEGMANWVAYAQARPAAAASAVGSLPAQGAVAGSDAGGLGQPASTAARPEVVCVQCNRIFSKEETIQYGTAYVCAACKPAFVQKLKEGAVTPAVLGVMDYAGFWIRFAAKLIDGIILGLVVGLPIIIVMVSTGFFARLGNTAGGQTPAWMMTFQLIAILAQLGYFIIFAGYSTFFHGKYGATPGKMACGLKVVTPEGAPIRYGRAFGRAMAEILSRMICDIGYIIAAFDGQKRALHDHIANTRVIRVR